VILAEVSHALTNFVRVETFTHRGAAHQWIDHVVKTDVAIQAYRNNCRIKINDIPTGQPLVDTCFLWWR
jgi:hypothetical protein